MIDPMSPDSQNRAVNLYREAGRLSLYHSAATADPELMVIAPDGWRVEAGELVLPWQGQDVQLGPGQVALAARFGYFGLAVFWEAGISGKDMAAPVDVKPKGRPKKRAARNPERVENGPSCPSETSSGLGTSPGQGEPRIVSGGNQAASRPTVIPEES